MYACPAQSWVREGFAAPLLMPAGIRLAQRCAHVQNWGNKTALEAEEVCWQEGGAFAVGEDHKEVMPWTGDTSVEVLPTVGKENCS